MKRRPGEVGLKLTDAHQRAPSKSSMRVAGAQLDDGLLVARAGSRGRAAPLGLGPHVDDLDADDVDAEELLDGLAHLGLVAPSDAPGTCSLSYCDQAVGLLGDDRARGSRGADRWSRTSRGRHLPGSSLERGLRDEQAARPAGGRRPRGRRRHDDDQRSRLRNESAGVGLVRRRRARRAARCWPQLGDQRDARPSSSAPRTCWRRRRRSASARRAARAPMAARLAGGLAVDLDGVAARVRAEDDAAARPTAARGSCPGGRGRCPSGATAWRAPPATWPRVLVGVRALAAREHLGLDDLVQQRPVGLEAEDLVRELDRCPCRRRRAR